MSFISNGGSGGTSSPATSKDEIIKIIRDNIAKQNMTELVQVSLVSKLNTLVSWCLGALIFLILPRSLQLHADPRLPGNARRLLQEMHRQPQILYLESRISLLEYVRAEVHGSARRGQQAVEQEHK